MGYPKASSIKIVMMTINIKRENSLGAYIKVLAAVMNIFAWQVFKIELQGFCCDPDEELNDVLSEQAKN